MMGLTGDQALKQTGQPRGVQNRREMASLSKFDGGCGGVLAKAT
jgi:hypothetical protein